MAGVDLVDFIVAAGLAVVVIEIRPIVGQIEAKRVIERIAGGGDRGTGEDARGRIGRVDGVEAP